MGKGKNGCDEISSIRDLIEPGQAGHSADTVALIAEEQALQDGSLTEKELDTPSFSLADSRFCTTSLLGIFAGGGFGKSFLCQAEIAYWAEQQVPVLIIDNTGEYAELAQQSGTTIQVDDANAKTITLDLNSPLLYLDCTKLSGHLWASLIPDVCQAINSHCAQQADGHKMLFYLDEAQDFIGGRASAALRQLAKISPQQLNTTIVSYMPSSFCGYKSSLLQGGKNEQHLFLELSGSEIKRLAKKLAGLCKDDCERLRWCGRDQALSHNNGVFKWVKLT